MVRWIGNNTSYICMALISLILFVFFRAVAVHERILRGVYPWAIGGEALVPALPWLVRWIWESVMEVFSTKKGVAP